jgi:hypothetical protein
MAATGAGALNLVIMAEIRQSARRDPCEVNPSQPVDILRLPRDLFQYMVFYVFFGISVSI